MPKEQFILTDSGFVIQELGDDGNYRTVARVAKRSFDDNAGERLVKLLIAGYHHHEEER